MKALLTAAALVLSMTQIAHAQPLKASQEHSVDMDLLEGMQQVPKAGDMTAKVVTEYAGTAYGVSRQYLIVYNMAAPSEGDDFTPHQTFDLGYAFMGQPKSLYSRKIDATTYSIALVSKQVDPGDGGANPQYPTVKTLVTVKFTQDGVANVADVKTAKMK
jgi:hypothetical protein